MELKSASYTDIVQEFLYSKFSSDVKVSEKCIIAVPAFININWKKHFRIVALIRKRTSHAVIIFRGKKSCINRNHDIYVLDVLPLNIEFKLDTDKTRSSIGEFHPAIISGEDFTLLDFDPLATPIHSVNDLGTTGFNRKKFHLDFTKDDFRTFSIHLSNASQFITKDEIYSSFDWLRKIQDQIDAVPHFDNDSTNSDSEIELTPTSENRSSIPYSTKSHLVVKDTVLAMGSFSSSLVGSESLIHNNIHMSGHVTKRSLIGFDRPSHRSLITKKSFEHYQSSPDLLYEPLDELIRSPSATYNMVDDNRQYAYIENRLRQREPEYCTWEDHTLFVGTWNVNGRVDDGMSLDEWLTPPNNTKYPDLYILGFQEIDLSIGSVALNRGNMSNLEERWLRLIENSGPFQKHSYKRLYRSRLAGILLIVYIDQVLAKSVPDPEVLSYKVPTGMFNVMGNKGAVGIRFRALNSNMCFINCHLAAGESNRLRRDQDFREIEKNLVFYTELGKSVSIYEHDLVFLMGDLNYRILNMEFSAVKHLAVNNKIAKLLDNDELLTCSKSVFKRFYEGTINFAPTYKFDPNTDEYDTSEKNRVPSYCDRIMWSGERCRILKYSSHMSLRSSDHKPVSAVFTVGLKKVDLVKRSKVQESIIRSIDLIYNLSLPQAKVDKQEIQFDSIHFYEHRQSSIVLTNIGHYEFLFNFKEIPGCPKIPDWLTVQPSEGTVNTNESCELIFEIFVNANNVIELNTAAEVQCILVLTLIGGKDYFITVTADLVPTCFGLPLTLLASLKEPVGTFTRKELHEECKSYIERPSLPTNVSKKFSIPKEMFMMVEHLLNNIDEEELFARPGSHAEIQCIREQLDVYGRKADFSNVIVHSVIEAMLMFLSSLYFPIIPTDLLKDCMQVSGNFLASLKVIAQLPLDHQHLFHYLTSFLRQVLENRSRNGTDIASLGILFVDLIFRPKNLDSLEREICSQFIKQFLSPERIEYFRANPSVLSVQ